jgi:hypothetical protein
MNLSQDNRSPDGGISGGGAGNWGQHQAAPAHPMTVGAVGFGPGWTMEDSMAASIVRLEQEREEANARIAMLEEQARILVAERDEARLQYRTTEALGMALAKTIGELKATRVELRCALRAIASMDTSQEASPQQCGAVLIAMNALEASV